LAGWYAQRHDTKIVPCYNEIATISRVIGSRHPDGRLRGQRSCSHIANRQGTPYMLSRIAAIASWVHWGWVY